MFNTAPVSPEAAANRAGQFTDAQRRRLRMRLVSMGVLTVLFVVLPAPLLFGLGLGLFDPEALELQGATWFGIGFFGLVALVLLGFAAWFGWQLLQTWQDLAEQRIEQGDGQVAWRRGKYRAEFEGRDLSLADVNLGPGPYRFNYLPRTRRILSAEQLSVGPGGSADDELRAALAQANNFPLDALTDLRAGRIGELRAALVRQAWLTAGLFSLGLAVFMGFVTYVAVADRTSESWMLLIFAAFVGAVIVALVWGAVNTTRDAAADRVATAEGLVQRQMRRSNRSTSYYYRLDRLSFNVGSAAYNALVEGRRYRLYYLPRARKLIGIEPAEA